MTKRIPNEFKIDMRRALGMDDARLLADSHVREERHIGAPKGGVPVCVTVNGYKIRIGTGTLDPDTLVFTVKLDEH